jgi:hypothetical protein
MDKYTKTILTIIAAAAVLVAAKLYMPPESPPPPPVRGDLLAIRQITDPQQRRAAFTNLLATLPIVWVHGGNIDASVSGSVEIDR